MHGTSNVRLRVYCRSRTGPRESASPGSEREPSLVEKPSPPRSRLSGFEPEPERRTQRSTRTSNEVRGSKCHLHGTPAGTHDLFNLGQCGAAHEQRFTHAGQVLECSCECRESSVRVQHRNCAAHTLQRVVARATSNGRSSPRTQRPTMASQKTSKRGAAADARWVAGTTEKPRHSGSSSSSVPSTGHARLGRPHGADVEGEVEGVEGEEGRSRRRRRRQ